VKFFLKSVKTFTAELQFDKIRHYMKTYVHLWLVFTTDVDSFLCELQTQAKETYFINDTGCVFCDILAEAKETVEHQISLIVNLKYQQLEHTSQPTLSQW